MTERPTPRTWNDGWRCAECCNGDRCDDPTHHDRDKCPHCKGTGIAVWNMYTKEAEAKALITERAAHEATRAELEAARKDAGRLNHIEQLAEEYGECWIQLTRGHDDRALYQLCTGYDEVEPPRANNVRAAIDAAMKEQTDAR